MLFVDYYRYDFFLPTLTAAIVMIPLLYSFARLISEYRDDKGAGAVLFFVFFLCTLMLKNITPYPVLRRVIVLAVPLCMAVSGLLIFLRRAKNALIPPLLFAALIVGAGALLYWMPHPFNSGFILLVSLALVYVLEKENHGKWGWFQGWAGGIIRESFLVIDDEGRLVSGKDYIPDGTDFTAEWFKGQKEGEVRIGGQDYRFQVIPVRDYRMIVLLDITEEKKLTDELESVNESLRRKQIILNSQKMRESEWEEESARSRISSEISDIVNKQMAHLDTALNAPDCESRAPEILELAEEAMYQIRKAVSTLRENQI